MTALQLSRAHLLRLVISENPDYTQGSKAEQHMEAQLAVSFRQGYQSGESLFFFTRLQFRSQPLPQQLNAGYAQVFAEIEGLFTLHTSVDSEGVGRWVLSNAASILLGQLRGMLAMVSGSFRPGVLQLPCIAIDDFISDQVESQNTETLEWLKRELSSKQTSSEADPVESGSQQNV